MQRLFCSWCDTVVREGEEPTSHTICDPCADKHFPEGTDDRLEDDCDDSAKDSDALPRGDYPKRDAPSVHCGQNSSHQGDTRTTGRRQEHAHHRLHGYLSQKEIGMTKTVFKAHAVHYEATLKCRQCQTRYIGRGATPNSALQEMRRNHSSNAAHCGRLLGTLTIRDERTRRVARTAELDEYLHF